MDGQMDGWMDGRTDGWMDRGKDGWVRGWTDRWNLGHTHIQTLKSYSVLKHNDNSDIYKNSNDARRHPGDKPDTERKISNDLTWRN